MKKKYGIFTKPQHVEKIVNFLNENTDIYYILSTNRYEPLAYEFDIGISYCFPWIIDSRYNDGMLLETKDWYNFHPAPLPFYKGWGNYQKGIKAGIEEWGVSLHRMTEHVDEGPVLKVKHFKLDSLPVNTQELGDISHYHLFQLFKETIELLEHCPETEEEFKKAQNKYSSVMTSNEKKIDWNCRLDELEKQLGICGSFQNKPCCGKCGSGLKIMDLSADKTEYFCPRCKNNIKVEHFKKYMEGIKI